MPPLASLLATLAVAPLLLRRSAVLLGGGAAVLLKPACTQADDAGALAKLEATLVNIQTVLDRWDDFTIECNYAEADREMMQNKTKLLEKASVKGAYMKDKSVVRNLCKINTRRLNTYYAADGPPQKSVKLLSSPEVTDRVEDLDGWITLCERYERAVSGARAASYDSGASDFSANTGFEKGTQASAPELDQARALTEEARDALTQILRAVGAPSVQPPPPPAADAPSVQPPPPAAAAPVADLL